MPRDLTSHQLADHVEEIAAQVEAHGSTLAYAADGIELWAGNNEAVRPDPEHVALLLTDPPYGIGFQALDKNFTPHSGDGVAGDDEPFDPTWLLAYPRLILWGANFYAQHLPQGGWVCWDKRCADQRDNGMSEAELAWTNLIGRTIMYRHRWHGNVRDSENGLWLHPTQKPAAMMRWLVERFTEPGDLVYDPYMGSGPVAQACLETGRRYIGVELEPRYVAIAAERLQRTTMPLPF